MKILINKVQFVNDYDDKRLKFDQIHGKELSYNNYNDMFASLEILNSLKKNSGTVIIKHANRVVYQKIKFL